jgi:undecaprenyl diphosphate synthase
MHLAIIMDGNGRWAEQRGLPRKAGHRAGVKAARRVIEAAAKSGISCLTLYAFSSDNWSRPPDEVAHLMNLFRRYLQSEVSRSIENGIRLNVIGRRDRLNPDLVRIIEQSETLTRDGETMLLRLAIDYSARDMVARSALRSTDSVTLLANQDARGLFAASLAEQMHAVEDAGDVDLLIRSGGERRLSDFLLWECAYAELAFMDTYWPDFSEADLRAALNDFQRRERRYGGLSKISEIRAAGAELPA